METVSIAPSPVTRASRLRRAIAAPLAIWTLIALILGGHHLADGDHARRADGSLVHVGAWVAGQDHAACDHHSKRSTVDRDRRAPVAAETCWLDQFTPPGAAAPRIIAFQPRAALPGRVPVLAPRPPATAAVLIVAPKTSPPA